MNSVKRFGKEGKIGMILTLKHSEFQREISFNNVKGRWRKKKDLSRSRRGEKERNFLMLLPFWYRDHRRTSTAEQTVLSTSAERDLGEAPPPWNTVCICSIPHNIKHTELDILVGHPEISRGETTPFHIRTGLNRFSLQNQSVIMGWGEYPPEYNARVHGPYDPARFYGKRKCLN